MDAKSPNAFLLSAGLHAAVLVLIVVFTFWAKAREPEVVTVFELVSGDGNNYDATAAPALGNSTTADEVDTNFQQTLKSNARQAERAVVRQYQKEKRVAEAAAAKAAKEEAARAAAEAKVEAAKRAQSKPVSDKKPDTMTYEEFMRQQGNKTSPSQTTAKPKAINPKLIDAKGITGGVNGGTTTDPGAGGRALSTSILNQTDAYFTLLRQRFRDNLDKPMGLSDLLQVRVTVYVSASGALSGARISGSSGNSAFDNAALAAVMHTASIGKRPDGEGDSREFTFRMSDE